MPLKIRTAYQSNVATRLPTLPPLPPMPSRTDVISTIPTRYTFLKLLVQYGLWPINLFRNSDKVSKVYHNVMSPGYNDTSSRGGLTRRNATDTIPSIALLHSRDDEIVNFGNALGLYKRFDHYFGSLRRVETCFLGGGFGHNECSRPEFHQTLARVVRGLGGD